MEQQFKIFNNNHKLQFLTKKKQEKTKIDNHFKKQQDLIRLQSNIRRFLISRRVTDPAFKDVQQKLQLLEIKRKQMASFHTLMAKAIYKMPQFFRMLVFVNDRNYHYHGHYILAIVSLITDHDRVCIKHIVNNAGFQYGQLIKLIRLSLFLFTEISHKCLLTFLECCFLEFNQSKLEKLFIQQKVSSTIYKLVQILKYRCDNIIVMVLMRNLQFCHFLTKEQKIELLIRNGKLQYLSSTHISQLLLSLKPDKFQAIIFTNADLSFVNQLYFNYISNLNQISNTQNISILNNILVLHNIIFNIYCTRNLHYICLLQFKSINPEVIQYIRSTPAYDRFLQNIPLSYYTVLIEKIFEDILQRFDGKSYHQIFKKRNEELEAIVEGISYLYMKINYVFHGTYNQLLDRLCSKKFIIGIYQMFQMLDIKNVAFSNYKNSYLLALVELYFYGMLRNLTLLDDIEFMDNSIGYNKEIIYNTILMANRIIIDLILIVHTEQSQYQSLLQAASKLIRSLYDRNFRLKLFDLTIFEGLHLQKQIHNMAFNLNHKKIEKYLTYSPFTLNFKKRLQRFYQFLMQDEHANGGYSNQISIRRGKQFPDAFSKLYNKVNMKKRFRVSFINEEGLREEGIDGGGLTKEFLNRVIKMAFKPEYGLFIETSTKQLLPNPYSQASDEQFEFIGSIVGKVIYQRITIQPKFCIVFLNIMLGKRNGIEDLKYIDKQIYKNLMSLKHMKQDISNHSLTFSFLENVRGKNIEIELKPGGKHILVRNENKLEFITKYADYKVNKQFAKQGKHFRKGFTSIIDKQWLEMFNYDEISNIICGNSSNFSIKDLKNHVKYQGYQEDDQTIQYFWQVVSTFTAQQKQYLLLFVTSCSRPPTLGFQQLRPRFQIVKYGDTNRLPMAHTCVNMLKLPNYNNKELLREKLIYAIQSKSGFNYG